MRLSDMTPLTDKQIRHSVYAASILATLIPPFLGGSLMSMIGYYPLPEFFLIFLQPYALTYVGCFLLGAYVAAGAAVRFITGLTHLDPALARARAQRAFARLPWLLLATITIYSAGGVLVADFTLEVMGVHQYTLNEHLYNLLGLVPVVLITVFPIYFFSVDRLGRYLGPRGISVTAAPLWVKLLMLGIVTPLLIDSILIGYYLNRTGYFEWQMLALWLSLALLAGGGTWLAWRSLRQGIAPLQSFISAQTGTVPERARATLTPQSLDELGTLTERYAELLSTQLQLSSNLEQAQLLANSILENAGALVLLLGRDGRILRFNHAAEQLSGYTFAEVQGKFPWDTVLPPEDSAVIRKNAFEALAREPQKLSGRYTNFWQSRNGERRLIDWFNTVLLDARGNMEFMISVGVDITAQRKTEEANVLLAERLKLATASAQIGIWDWNVVDGSLIWDDRVFAMHGIRNETASINFEDWTRTLHPDDLATVTGKVQRSLQEDVPYDTEYRAYWPDGTLRHIRAFGHVVRDTDGKPLRMIGAVLDITERIRQQEALRTSNQIVNAVLDTTPVMIATLDRDMNFVRVNRAYANADHKDPDYFIGKNHFALFPNPQNESIFRRVVETGEAYATAAKPFEYASNPERGVTHWDWTLSPIKDPDESVSGLVLSLTNVTERIQALEAAQRSEENLKALSASLDARVRERTEQLADASELNERILSASALGIAVYKQSGQCIFANEALSLMLGASREQILAQNFRNIASWREYGLLQVAESVLAGGGEQSLEAKMRTTFGLELWLDCYFTRFTRAGEPHLLAIGRDTTARKQAEESLKSTAERLSNAQRIAKMGDYALDLRSGVLAWSDAIYKLLQLDPGSTTPSLELMLSRIHPDDRAAIQETMTTALSATYTPDNTGQARLPDLEYRVVRTDGALCWLHSEGIATLDENGHVIHVQGTVQEITARKEAQERANVESRRSEYILETARDGFFAADMSGYIRVANPAFCALLGYSRHELLRMSISDIEANENPQQVVQHIKNVMATGHDRFDTRHRRKDGSLVELEISVNLVEIGGEKLFYAFSRDITPRKEAEATLIAARDEANRANRSKNEFLSRMSHELRTPMNAILGFAQILEAEPLPPELLDYAQEIHRAGDHLLVLINELLDLSRIESGKLAVTIKPTRLRDVVIQALNIIQPLATNQRVAIFNHCTQDSLVLVDDMRLRQILVNLLSNAIKYNRQGGNVTIHCHVTAGGRMRLAVVDTGPGIPAEHLGKLFIPFERLGAERSAIEGAGIGLALSKQLAELMEATLGAESAPGQGSTFWIEMALSQDMPPAETVAQSPVAPESRPEDTRTVLYIEDNAANLRVIEAVFRKQLRLKLLTATDGRSGLEHARRYHPDVILLDIHLPGMDGYQVLDALQSDPATRTIPVIALSADAMPNDIEKGLASGFVRYLTKPVKVNLLMKALDALLARQPQGSDPAAH